MYLHGLIIFLFIFSQAEHSVVPIADNIFLCLVAPWIKENHIDLQG